MPFRSIRWKLTFAYLFTVFAAVSVLGLYLSRWTEESYVSSLRSELLSESRFVGNVTEKTLPKGPAAVDALAREMGHDLGCRVTLIARDGSVLGESEHSAAGMDRHNRRPEFIQAVSKGSGWSIRYSHTLGARQLYVATSFGDREHPTGVARLSQSLSRIDHEVGRIHQVFFLSALAVFVLAAIIGIKISANIAGPISQMSKIAGKYAEGDLWHRLKVKDKPGDEIDDLARALNNMAFELKSMMNQFKEEKLKLETILAKTDDGLIVVDSQAKVQMINPAAARILGTHPNEADSKTVIESTLNHDLSELANRVLKTGQPSTLEIRLADSRQTCLNVYVAPLEKDGPWGALIVMHDLTAARHMDSVRRDFVANVSHELRTPLASVRAMAETIALRGRSNPKISQEYSEKIVLEVDRLTAISEDLLDLAKIESGQMEIRREEFSIAQIADDAALEFMPAANKKGVRLESRVDSGITVSADMDAVRQILVNLVDNAVKYTPSGGSVYISAKKENKLACVQVTDTGIGIPHEDISRIFERFYRVDKARSRESGGTGLGLSIVKHLVESHGGNVSVKSGASGSTFTFTLPL
jgi:two-component system phosphate regulon sensor histidine kinase PhoR